MVKKSNKQSQTFPPRQLTRQSRIRVTSKRAAQTSEGGSSHITQNTLSQLLINNPLPMWVYDLETLAFLEVNQAAIDRYGYSRSEFLKMRIADIRPAEDIPRLMQDVKAIRPDFQHSQQWRHKLKNEQIIDVEITSHLLEYGGSRAALVIAQDITERKRAEEQIRRFASIVENSEDAILSKSLEGIILSWNKGAEKVYGYQPEEIIGLPVSNLMPPERKSEMMHNLSEIRHGRDVKNFETERIRKDGTRIIISIALSPVRDDRGGVVAVSAIERDITLQKRAYELDQFQAGLLAAVSDPVIATDLQFNVLSWNAAAEATYGWTAAEVIGKPLKDFLQNEFVNDTREASIRAVMENGFWKGEVFQKRRDGVRIAVLASVASFKDSQGKHHGLVAVNRDITERRKIEDALAKLLEAEKAARVEAEAARQQLSFLAEASRLLSETFDYNDRLKQVAAIAVPAIADWCAIDILEADGSIQRAVVVHSDPVKVKLAFDLQVRYPPDPSAPSGVYNVLRTGVSEFYPVIPDSLLVSAAQDEEHLRLLRSLGFKSAMVIPFRAHEQNFGAITIVMAESERQYTKDDLATVEGLAQRAAILIYNARLYAESQQLNAQLEQRVRLRTLELETINQELEAFTYSVSHDLRAPLRHIAGYVELLSANTPILDEKSQRYLQTISESAKRMSNLIDNLLSFSRMGRADFEKTSVDVNAVINEVIDDFRPEISDREIEWEIGSFPRIYGDRAMIKLVFTNLISNALKFTLARSPAQIEIGYNRIDQSENMIYVRDNGVGFDMQYADKLFGIFQRLHRTDEFEGTGVGLANVRRIIHRHGGRTWAEGVPDRGATFYFAIPNQMETPHE